MTKKESPSVRGCGLKCLGTVPAEYYFIVTLSARVWIEIDNHSIARYALESPSVRGCGLK